MNPSRRTGLAPLLACLLGLLGAAAARAADEVVVISPNWDGIKEETARAFAAWHQKKYGTRAVVRWRESGGGGSQILRFLRTEFKGAPSAGIDVLYGAGSDPYRELAQDGLLTRYDPPPEVLAAIPAQLNGLDLTDPNHLWFSGALSGFGIIVNERARRVLGLPEVRTWTDLADYRTRNWITAADPRASSSSLSIDEIILQACGWEKGWAALMETAGNTRNFLTSSAASAVEVGVGDAVYGVAIDMYGNAQAGYYGARNVGFVLPEGQTVITPDCLAILKNPPHPETAKHFVEFVLSREGQMLWMAPKGSPGGATENVINRMSILPALYDELAGTTPIVNNPFKMRFSFTYSGKVASQRRPVLSVLLGVWMIDTHDLLARAWDALNAPGGDSPDRRARRDSGLAEFLAPPCSEAELLHIADTDWKNPVQRTALVNAWQAEAIRRYRHLIDDLPSTP